MKLSVDRAIRQAATFSARGQKAEAEKLYRAILERFPANRRALEGIETLHAPPGNASDHLRRGDGLLQAGRLEEAVAAYDIALRLKPDLIEAHNNRGTALKDLGRKEDALAAYEMVIRYAPDIAVAHFNRALTLKELNRLDEALAGYDRTIRLKPDLAEAYLNRGNLLRTLHRTDDALASYDEALRLRPDYVDVLNNRGFALQEMQRFEEALASYDEALRIKPDHVDSLNNRGYALQWLKRPVEARDSYAEALRLKPDFGAALVQLHYQKALLCDWDGVQESFDLRGFDVVTAAIPPFQMLRLEDNPARQLEVATAWTKASSPMVRPPLPRPAKHPGKLRIGYFSSDFFNHATLFLMARMFELHDRNRFEIHAFSYGPDKQDEMQRRFIASVDHYHDVRALGDEEVASLSRRHEIDVAVDLKGYTFDARANVFAYRAAPVQINYLGYPGSMGADFIDYIIADPVLIPPESRQFYSEKIIYLPHSYQANDNLRHISPDAFTRAQLGLPDDGFVFCCFNNNYKICPTAFDIWMRLLHKVEGSVLWLFEGDEWSQANLLEEAAARGIAPDRLVFAERVIPGDHLARHRCADLFLDTFNYNAHTTTSDALWAGLPVVTRAGQSFAARVAASLLGAVGMPELVTHTLEDYERLALELATQPERLAAVRAKLAANRLTTPLFDSALFTRHIEAAYETVFQRCVDGLPPAHIQMTAN